MRGFSRYHKYTLGTELRDGSRRILQRIIEANEARDASDREPALETLRRDIEHLKVTARLAQESEAFSSTRAYLHVAEQVVGIARQNEGWLRRLVARLRERYPWLAEYFEWCDWRVDLRCPVPRFALRFKDQVASFREHLPGHVLMVEKGVFWQVVVPRSVVTQAPAGRLPVADGQRVRRCSPGSAVERRLWQSGAPVAWIGETGRRVTDIAERAQVCRWTGAGSP